MRPCVGMLPYVPALCTWKELCDGTYGLVDVERFNQTMDTIKAGIK